jgi:hypothetical protein
MGIEARSEFTEDCYDVLERPRRFELTIELRISH